MGTEIKKIQDVKKPPEGLIPEFLHKELRLREIHLAIERYKKAGYEPSITWLIEAEDLEEWLSKYYKKYVTNKL